MKRKVVKHGPATYIISLPSKWVKEHNIKKGDELDVSMENERLIVSLDEKPHPLSCEIDITDLDRTSIMYILRSLYRLGYDIIKVNFENPKIMHRREKKQVKVLDVIHQETNRLIGYEVILEKEDSCEIQDLQTLTDKDFSSILRRIFLLLNDTTSDFITGAKKGNKSLLETIECKHDTITKFVSYCLRLLNKLGHQEPIKTNYYFHIIAYLDRVMDIIKYAARDAIKYKKPLDDSTMVVLEVIQENIRTYYDLFYKYDNKKVLEINTNRYAVEDALKNLLKNVKTEELIIATKMSQILDILLDLLEARTALNY